MIVVDQLRPCCSLIGVRAAARAEGIAVEEAGAGYTNYSIASLKLSIHIYPKTLDLYVCFFNSTIFYYFNHIKVIRNTNKSGGAAHVKMTRKVNLIWRTHHKRKKKGVDESVRND